LSISADITATGSSDITLVGGSGVSFATGITVDADAGVLTVDGQTGTITMAANSRLLTAATVMLIADDMAFDVTGNTRLGGDTAGTTLAKTTILRPYTDYRKIEIAANAGSTVSRSSYPKQNSTGPCHGCADRPSDYREHQNRGLDADGNLRPRCSDTHVWRQGSLGISQTGPIDLRTSTRI
jgi:hypothetical protein